METIRMKLADIQKAAKNVRMHTEKQLQEYERSVRMFGQIRPIVVDEEGNILAGNGLYETLLRMKFEEADVYRLENLTPAQKKKLAIADNKIYNLGVENLTVLNEFIEELRDDLDIPGFDEDILRQMVSDAEEVTEKICEYGTLDENEIQELRRLGERQNSAYENGTQDNREARTASATSEIIQEAGESEARSVTENPDNVISEPERRFVICPGCGREIWL